MHKVKIISDSEGKTKLYIDGVDMSMKCSSFTLKQEGGEFPKLTVTVSCSEVEVDAEAVEMAAPAATEAAKTPEEVLREILFRRLLRQKC